MCRKSSKFLCAGIKNCDKNSGDTFVVSKTKKGKKCRSKFRRMYKRRINKIIDVCTL